MRSCSKNHHFSSEDEHPILSYEEDDEIAIETPEDIPLSIKSKGFRDEMKMNIKMAFPMMVTNICQFAIIVETTAFAGRLPELELQGVALGISLIQSLGWMVIAGFVTASDTMMSQAFGSANKKKTGLFLQRSLLLFNLIPICLWALHINFEPILILLRQDPEISRITGEYTTTFIPGFTFMANYLLLARYMQNQNCLWVPVVAAGCGNVFNICSQLIFVFHLGYGFRACAICHSLSFGIMVIVEIIYILKTKFYLPTWPGFQLEAFYDWKQLFKLGIWGMCHITFEVLIWESGVFLGGLLGPVQLATQSIILQVNTGVFLIYFGAGIASNIRVGQCLGANRPHQAKAAFYAGLITTAAMVVVVATVIISLRYQIPWIFTDKEDVIKMIIAVFPADYVIILTDPFSGVLSGGLRGCGRQAVGGIITFISFYILALPISIVSAFVFNLDVPGIWLGNTVGSVSSITMGFIVIGCQNWKKQAKLAQERITYSTLKSNKEDSEKTELMPNNKTKHSVTKNPNHIRTPSYPVTCSTEYVELPEPKKYVTRRILIEKLFLLLIVLIIFFVGLMIKIFLPTSVYRSQANNHTAV